MPQPTIVIPAILVPMFNICGARVNFHASDSSNDDPSHLTPEPMKAPGPEVHAHL
jgi:hypothetical protein